jgi:periplasmic protein TonB
MEDPVSSVRPKEKRGGKIPPPPPVNLPSPGHPHLHLLPPPVTDFSQPLRSDAEYRKRITVSILLSCILNFFLLWLLVTGALIDKNSSETRQKARAETAKKIPKLVILQKKPELPQIPKTPPRRRTFLETDPSQASTERPKDAAFYSEHNTQAAQPLPNLSKSGEIPKADGNNTKTMNTESVRPGAKTPPPSPPSPQQKPSPQATPTPPRQKTPPPQKSPALEEAKPGEYALLKKQPSLDEQVAREIILENEHQNSRQMNPEVPPSASVINPQRVVPAAKSKLEGGVPRQGALAFNSAESPFASYDKKVIGKIGAYWQFQVRDKFYGESVGEVEIAFKLLADGKITDLQVVRNSANSVLAGWCIRAIERSAPFDPFPETMRTMAGNSREGTITFAY